MALDQTSGKDAPDTQPHIIERKKEEAGKDKQLSCYLAFCHRCRLCNKQKETTTRLTSTYHRMSPHGAGAIVKLDRRVAEDSQLLVYDLLS